MYSLTSIESILHISNHNLVHHVESSLYSFFLPILILNADMNSSKNPKGNTLAHEFHSLSWIQGFTLLRIISGARYSGVPHNVQVRPFTLLAKPKSVTWRQKNARMKSWHWLRMQQFRTPQCLCVVTPIECPLIRTETDVLYSLVCV